MKAFFSVIVLLLLTVGVNAYTPGPTVIRECPKCNVPIEQATMASGNNFGARYWSDGKMGAPMLPDYPWLVKCPKCEHLFWIDEAKKLGDTRKGWKGQDKLTPYKLGLPTVSDFYSIVSKIKDKRKQRYIRNHLWHCANDPYRDRLPKGKVSFSAQAKANMIALSNLLDKKDPEQRLMKAEIARELGQYDQCLKLLNISFGKQLRDTAFAIRLLAQERYALVIEFSRPVRYRHPVVTANDKPSDIENRLFVRAMRDSCTYVANGLLSRYKVDSLLHSDPAKLKAAIRAGAAKGDDSAVAVVLNAAAMQDSVEAVQVLLGSGARVNGHCDEFWTPLITACLCGSEKAASLLIDWGANVNVAAQYGLTPLNLACRERYPCLAKLLLDKGANVNQGDEDSTPLMTLCTYTWNYQSDISKVDRAKRTLDMIRLLVDHVANVNGVETTAGSPKSEFWSTPLIEICRTEFPEDDSTFDRYTKAEKAACESLYLDIIRLLLDNKADINKGDYDGQTPLAHACEAGNQGAVKLLLEKGADVNKASRNGITALDIANKLSDKSIAKILLEHGAKPKAGK